MFQRHVTRSLIIPERVQTEAEIQNISADSLSGVGEAANAGNSAWPSRKVWLRGDPVRCRRLKSFVPISATMKSSSATTRDSCDCAAADNACHTLSPQVPK